MTPAEVAFWVEKIDSGAVSRGGLVLEFFAAQPILRDFGTPQERAVANTTLQIIENRITVAREFAKPENSEGLLQAAAHNAGVAALEGVDETQASVDAALARLNDSGSSTSAAMAGIATDGAQGSEAEAVSDVGAENSGTVVAADPAPEANDMLIA